MWYDSRLNRNPECFRADPGLRDARWDDYERDLEFDSDELNLLTLDWDDVRQALSAGVMQVAFLDDIHATGKLVIDAETVRVIGEEDQEFSRSDLLSITAGVPQETQFDDVVAGEPESESSGALAIGTIFDIEITDGFDFVYTYRLQLSDAEFGPYTHHMVATFETEWTSVLDFDVSFVWDRTTDPRPDSNMVVPDEDDFRLIVGLGIDF